MDVVVMEAGKEGGAFGVDDGIAGGAATREAVVTGGGAEAGGDLGDRAAGDLYVSDRDIRDRDGAGEATARRPQPRVADQHAADASQERTEPVSAPSSGAAGPGAGGRRGGSIACAFRSAGQVTVPSGRTSCGPWSGPGAVANVAATARMDRAMRCPPPPAR